jgi:hypothetical protein
MREVDRGLIILQPKQAFVDWLNCGAIVGDPISLAEARQDNDAFLIPEFDSEGEAMAYVVLHATEILEHALEDWCGDNSPWPEKLDSKLLLAWFDVKMCSLLFDMVDEGQNRHGLN